MQYEATLTSAPSDELGPQQLDADAASPRVDRDFQLVEALRAQAPLAAERLLDTFGDRAYRLAIRITGNARDAEEAVQDGFWSVIQKIDTFRAESSFGSWIYRIVANAAYQKLRVGAHRRQEISLDEVLPSFREDGRHVDPIIDWSASVHDPAVQSELRSALSAAIDELPAAHRAVFLLHDVDRVSMAEVADSLGITVMTAKSRAHRARLFLRKRLSIFMSGPNDGARPREEPAGSQRHHNSEEAGAERHVNHVST